MAKTWTDQGRARYRETKRREREKRAKQRRKRIEAVCHPVKAAAKRWGFR